MPFINQPPSMQSIFNDLSNRITKLENAQRFTAPAVNFDTAQPANPRQGDIFYDLDSERLVYWDGSAWYKLTQTAL